MGRPPPWTVVSTEPLQDCAVFQVQRSMARSPRWYDAVCETEVATMEGSLGVVFDAFEDNFQLAMSFVQAQALGYLGYLRAMRAETAGEAS